MLAVGIGNAHGFYKDAPNIRFDLLEQLAAASAVPLVLHGTTGLADDVVRRCVAMGMAKANLGTLIRTRCVEFTRDVIAEGKHQNHPWRVGLAVKDRLKPLIAHMLRDDRLVRPRGGRAMSTHGLPATSSSSRAAGRRRCFNASLFGVIDEARRLGRFARVLGARFGVGRAAQRRPARPVVRPAARARAARRLRPARRSARRGTSSPTSDVEQIVDHAPRPRRPPRARSSAATARCAAPTCSPRGAARCGYDCCVIGVPKTIDNDIPAHRPLPRLRQRRARTSPSPSATSRWTCARSRSPSRSTRPWAAAPAGSPARRCSRETDEPRRAAPRLPAGAPVRHRAVPRRPRPRRPPPRLGRRRRARRGSRTRRATGVQTPRASQRDALDRPVPGGVAAHLAEVVAARLEHPLPLGKAGTVRPRVDAARVAGRPRRRRARRPRRACARRSQAKRAQMVALRPLDANDRTPATSSRFAKSAAASGRCPRMAGRSRRRRRGGVRRLRPPARRRARRLPRAAEGTVGRE